ncbi:hypothetical protein AYK25_02575 [Thermoplasmatales archaeon SM1-50]|nr:MAG: hypothetical protein AYK25_02575 [Thermoplasmatales archaeon SM1-50]
MKIQFIRIIICLLLIFPVFSVTTVADSNTNLEIKIVGSLPLPYFSKNVLGVILNAGDETAHNISYNMTITGGFGNTINVINHGYENEILPHNALGVGIYGTYGFGLVVITLTASAINAETVTGTAKGVQIGSFTWIPLSWPSLLINN